MGKKQNFKLIKRVFIPLCSFEMFYALLIKYLITPCFSFLYESLLKYCQIPYLSVSNILLALKNPILDLGLLALVLIAGYFINLEIAAIVYCLSNAQKGEKCNLWTVLKFSVAKSLRVLLPSGLPLLLFSLVLLPISPLSFSSSEFATLTIPKFITGSINTPLLWVAYIAFFAAILGISIFGFFTYHIFFLKGDKVLPAFKESINTIKGRVRRTTWGFITSQLKGLIVPVLFLILVGTVLVLYAIGNQYEITSYYGIYLGLKSTFFLLVTRVPVIMGYAWLTSCYLGPMLPKEKKKLNFWGLIPFLVLLFLTVLSALVTCIKSAEEAKYKNWDNNILVISHRGVSSEAPENTLPAYDLAWLYRAPWAETDVQLTKDGKLLLHHGNSLKRMIGVDKKTNEMTLAEIQAYPIVNCPNQYEELTLSTLDELLDQSQGHIKLIIELKCQDGNDEALAKAVLEQIQAKGFEEQCAIHSENLPALLAFRELNKTIPIGWCTPMIQGEIEDIPVDFFSLEQTFLNQETVDRIHSVGKKIYVWTVNDPIDMNRSIDLKVDGIITDEVQNAIDITQATSIVDHFVHDLLNDQIDWNNVDY